MPLGSFRLVGWCRERANLERWNGQVRYALIVSISAAEANIDIYTPFANAVPAQVQIQI
jgi:hypothetical protein